MEIGKNISEALENSSYDETSVIALKEMEFKEHAKIVTSAVLLSPEILVTGSYDRFLFVYNILLEKRIQKIEVGILTLELVKLSRSSFIACGMTTNSEGKISGFKYLKNDSFHEIFSIDFSSFAFDAIKLDDALILAHACDEMHLIDVKKGKTIGRLRDQVVSVTPFGFMLSKKYSSNFFICTDEDTSSSLKLINHKRDELLKTVVANAKHFSGLESFLNFQDIEILVVSCLDKNIYLYNSETSETLKKIKTLDVTTAFALVKDKFLFVVENCSFEVFSLFTTCNNQNTCNDYFGSKLLYQNSKFHENESFCLEFVQHTKDKIQICTCSNDRVARITSFISPDFCDFSEIDETERIAYLIDSIYNYTDRIEIKLFGFNIEVSRVFLLF